MITGGRNQGKSVDSNEPQKSGNLVGCLQPGRIARQIYSYSIQVAQRGLITLPKALHEAEKTLWFLHPFTISN